MSKSNNFAIWTLVIGSVLSIFVVSATAYLALRPSTFEDDSNVIMKCPRDPNSAAEVFVSHHIAPNLLVGKFVIKVASCAGHRLKFGEYHLPPNVSIWRAIGIISSGHQVVHKFCIPEGLSVAETIEKLNNDKYLQGEVTEIPAEGSLLPATYNFNYPTTRQEIIKKAEAAMRRFLNDAWQQKSPDCFLETPEQVVTLASIVEKESPGVQLNKIAGMYLSRLSKKMRLQADPTVLYGLYKGVKNGKKLTYADLKDQSPYNTYVHSNLPPTPIANPGKAAILAVLHPALTGDLFMYYDMRTMRSPVFAKTFQEHRKNIAKFRK